MSADQRAKAAQLRGFLEMLREHTRGGEDEVFALMNKQDRGVMVWTGKSPRSRRRKK